MKTKNPTPLTKRKPTLHVKSIPVDQVPDYEAEGWHLNSVEAGMAHMSKLSKAPAIASVPISVPAGVRALPVWLFFAGLGVREVNIIRRMGVKVLGDLHNVTILDLMAQRQCGYESARKIVLALANVRDRLPQAITWGEMVGRLNALDPVFQDQLIISWHAERLLYLSTPQHEKIAEILVDLLLPCEGVLKALARALRRTDQHTLAVRAEALAGEALALSQKRATLAHTELEGQPK